eukprot:CAMPEP_0167753358 /NCGR_PEP_ID=MMETSP0110_2-20121227/7666_1 /TAXON_ID=629695 /ORGANISM="Gymnochlora sp., Strain CCMP2014" /LENGTH=158 /DNA_ID=CAMNT_0007639109 /DNA_START=2455 /DNA_END=2931 /DNA_ORIENTATION=-
MLALGGHASPHLRIRSSNVFQFRNGAPASRRLYNRNCRLAALKVYADVAGNPEGMSPLERMKRAKAYQMEQRRNKGEDAEVPDDEIREVEKIEPEEEKSSQFNNIKTTLDSMKTLEEKSKEVDQKAYDLLKKLGLSSPEPFVDGSELKFNSDEINDNK